MSKFARVLFWVSVSVCGALGVAHTIFTFLIFHHLTERALYFAGTGLAAILLALLNIATWCAPAPPNRLSRSLTHAANALLAMFAVAAIIAVPQPQAYVGATGFWALLVAGFLLDRASRATVATPPRY